MSPRTRNTIEVLVVCIACAVFIAGMLSVLTGSLEAKHSRETRIWRAEDQLDDLDATAVQLLGPNLPDQQRVLIQRRINHLQAALCGSLEDWDGELPEHLLQAEGDVCEGG